MNPKQCLDYVNLKANRKVLVDLFRETLGLYKEFLI